MKTIGRFLLPPCLRQGIVIPRHIGYTRECVLNTEMEVSVDTLSHLCSSTTIGRFREPVLALRRVHVTAHERTRASKRLDGTGDQLTRRQDSPVFYNPGFRLRFCRRSVFHLFTIRKRKRCDRVLHLCITFPFLCLLHVLLLEHPSQEKDARHHDEEETPHHPHQ